MSDIKREIRELPAQEVIYEDDLFALDSDESNQTGKITYKQLIDKIREDIAKEIQESIDSGGQHDSDQDSQIAEMNKTLKGICNKVYPVGSIFITLDDKNPADLFGGEWERLEDRFLLGFGSTYNDLGDRKGAATVQLSADESGCPAHRHGFTQPTANNAGGGNTGAGGSHRHSLAGDNDTLKSGTSYMRPKSHGAGSSTIGYYTSYSDNHTHTISAHSHQCSGGAVQNSTAIGASAAHNNMPPYIVVNMWKRTELADISDSSTEPTMADNDYENNTSTIHGNGVITDWIVIEGTHSYYDVVIYNDNDEIATEYANVTSELEYDVENERTLFRFNDFVLPSGYYAVISFTAPTPGGNLSPGDIVYDSNHVYIKSDGTTEEWTVPADVNAAYVAGYFDAVVYDTSGNQTAYSKANIATQRISGQSDVVKMIISSVPPSGYVLVVTYST